MVTLRNGHRSKIGDDVMRLLAKAAFAAGVLVALGAGVAHATDLQVGDRVQVGAQNDETGTVIAVGGYASPGSVLIKVHLDRIDPDNRFPTIGPWYDEKLAGVTKVAGGAGAQPVPAGPATGPAGQVQAGPVAPPPAAQQPPTVPMTGNVATPAMCQQLIRANYPPGGADQTISVNFLNFQMSAPRPFTATYANDPGGVGHTVTAWPVHAKFTVLTHFADPYADDRLNTYDAQYMCFKLPVGGWVVEMMSRLPGGETAQYIKKAHP
jgi:hypothetical protein